MSTDAYFRLGEKITLGSHTFTAEEIKRFAAKYDPQPFHMAEEAARGSVLGGLCASGWHTCAMWMRYNLQSLARVNEDAWSGSGPPPEFGPSPGFSNLKWLNPVYAGDTITFTRKALSHRPFPSRPGWRILSSKAAALNGDGQPVIEFDSLVLVKIG